MRTLPALAVLGLVAGLVSAQGTSGPAATTGPAPAGSEQDILAAESFRHSAVGMTCSPADEPARAARLVVLTRWAERLTPDDPRVQLLLADIYFAQAKARPETKALGQYLKAFPADYARWVRWISSSISQSDSAPDRAGFLASIVDRHDVPTPVRAKAAALLADVRQGQGMTDEAIAAARTAIDLDPYGPDGLAVWIRLEGKSAAAGEVRVLLRSLQGNPHAAGQAWRLGLEMGKLGLHKEALRFFDHALAADTAATKFSDLAETLQIQYGNALLDAGEAAKAVELLDPACERHGRNADLKCLLVEALQASGKMVDVEKRLDTMAAAYKDAGEPASAGAAAEQAWFFVNTKPSPNIAVVLAERAVKADPNEPLYQRILGAAELSVAKATQGQERLEKLRGTDVYACVYLAERYASVADHDKCEKAIFDGVALARSGPAWRRLVALAAKNKVTIAPPKGADEAAKLAVSFDKTYLEMSLTPEKFLAVELKAAQQEVACGQALVVVATLKNIGPVDIPLGEQGLLRPQMALSGMVGTNNKLMAKTARLPMVVWPAPRYLRPNESIQATVRVDVGELATALQQRPLEDLAVLIAGTLDPQPKGASALPTLRIEPARMVRKGLLGDFNQVEPALWVQAYKFALGRIVADIRRGSLEQRVLAARQTAALLAMAGEAQAGRIELPKQLADSVDRRVMLSMMRAVLADPSPVVRQEMITSLNHVGLDATAMGLLAPAIEDPAAMVRCRLVEMLGAGKTAGYLGIADMLSKDSDELVREMAKAFQPK